MSSRAPVFIDGERDRMLSGPTIAEEFIGMVNEYVDHRWGANTDRKHT